MQDGWQLRHMCLCDWAGALQRSRHTRAANPRGAHDALSRSPRRPRPRGPTILSFGLLSRLIIPCAKAVSLDSISKGIIIGGSGQGEAIAANRIKKVRAAVYYGGPEDIVKLSREHNDANILSLGARFIKEETIYNIIDLWLKVPFEGGRHIQRIKK